MNRAQIRGTNGAVGTDTDARMQHLREGPEFQRLVVLSVSQHHLLVDVAQSGQEGDRVEGCAAGIGREDTVRLMPWRGITWGCVVRRL